MPKTVNLKIDKFLGLVSDNAGDTNLKIGQCSTFTNFKTIEGYKARKRDGYLAQLPVAGTGNISGQWYGEVQNIPYHLFANNGHIWQVSNKASFVATISIANPAVVTKTTHGLAINDTIIFSTTIALPTGLTAGTTYYVSATGFTSGAFSVSASLGGADIETTGTQSGTQTVSPKQIDLGAMITTNGVEFFYFGDCVYMQNGTQYKKWTGSGTISDVSGYIPKIMVSRNMGSTVTGTSYEGLNNLTAQRIMTFNGVSGQTIAYLPETNITSIDSVLVNGALQTITTHYTQDLVAGTVTFGTAPSVALDNVEITWTNLAKTEYFNGTGSQVDFQLSETNITGVSNVYINNASFPILNGITGVLVNVEGRLNKVNHGLVDNQPFRLVGNDLPASLLENTTYYAAPYNNDIFYVRSVSGGTVLPITDSGSGAMSFITSWYTTVNATGIVTFTVAPSVGTKNVSIIYASATTNYGDISRQTHNRVYGGKNDSRIFLFGYDHTVYYSGLADGVPSAEYFPVLNYVQVGSNNSNITDLAKMFDRLIIFKESTTGWSTYEYDTSLGVQFPTYPLNDAIGCSVKGSVQIIRNNPFTVFGNTIQELVSSNVRDERTYPKEFKSKDIQPLLNAETMTSVITFDNQADLEYWLIIGNKAYIYNYNFEVWNYYEFGHTITSIEYVNGIMLGTSSGQIMKISYAYATDNATTITSTIKTGRINYGTDSYKKIVNNAWVQINRNGTNTSVIFKADADGVSDKTVKTLTYTTETEPITVMCQPKLKPFDYVQYSFTNNSADKLTVVSLEAPAVLTISQK